jgi:hypothetical protein
MMNTAVSQFSCRAARIVGVELLLLSFMTYLTSTQSVRVPES